MTTQDPQNTQPPAPQAPPVPQVPQPYGTTNAAGQPVYGQPAYYGPARPTNTLAIVAFVLAFFVSLAAIICGHIALGQIKRTGEAGHGLALAAVILGYVFLGLTVLFVIIYAIVLVAIFAAAGSAANYG